MTADHGGYAQLVDAAKGDNTRYNPDEQVLRSRKSISEERASSSTSALGVPGLASNTPGANPVNPNGSAGAPKDKAQRREDVNNYFEMRNEEDIEAYVGALQEVLSTNNAGAASLAETA